jgi:hypothetical protein
MLAQRAAKWLVPQIAYDDSQIVPGAAESCRTGKLAR